MKILSISLRNFRSIKNLSLDFKEQGSLIFGKNGLGKTNLMEAISYFALGKSFRMATDAECVMAGENSTHLSASFLINRSLQKIDIALNPPKKVVNIQNKKINKLSQLYQLIKVVYFSPDDIRVVSGTPNERRRFFDLAISQYGYYYLFYFKQFKKILKQRNALLKNPTINQSEKKIWDEQYAEIVAEIMKLRYEYLIEFKKNISESYLEISSQSEKLDLDYYSSSKIPIHDFTKEKYLALLHESTQKEIFYQKTLSGPHLDDYSFLINGMDARKYGSQGQKRSLAIASKLVQAKLITQSSNENPILIFDDVLVDLDQDRNKKIMHMLNRQHQIFIATPNKEIYSFLNLPEINLEELI